VGSFVGDTWQEWNGQFRDDVRRFLRGDNGLVSRKAHRLRESACTERGALRWINSDRPILAETDC
jgi:pullulanase/glycogen debranching enzyme